MIKQKQWPRVGLMLFMLGLMLGVLGCAPQTHEFAGAVLPDTQPMPDFTLTAANDQPVSLSDYSGKYVFVYFGYTFCPDLCPDTLAKLARVRDELGAGADQVQVIMISVDPARDTPEILADYVSHFDPTFVGITGTKEEIDAVGVPYGLYYEAHEGTAASGYLVDHTARTFLIDKAGVARVAYPFDATTDALLADMEWLLAHE